MTEHMRCHSENGNAENMCVGVVCIGVWQCLVDQNVKNQNVALPDKPNVSAPSDSMMKRVVTTRLSPMLYLADLRSAR